MFSPVPLYGAVHFAKLRPRTFQSGSTSDRCYSLSQSHRCVSNAGFMLLMVDDIGSVLLKSTLLLASAYGVLDPAQLYATVAVLAAALWFTYRYFTEVWPNREKVYVPEPWKGD